MDGDIRMFPYLPEQGEGRRSAAYDQIGTKFQPAEGRIAIMAGAGIQENSAKILKEQTKITSFHMSGKKIRESGMQFRNPNVAMGLPGMGEYEIWETSADAVAAVRKVLSGY